MARLGQGLISLSRAVHLANLIAGELALKSELRPKFQTLKMIDSCLRLHLDIVLLGRNCSRKKYSRQKPFHELRVIYSDCKLTGYIDPSFEDEAHLNP